MERKNNNVMVKDKNYIVIPQEERIEVIAWSADGFQMSRRKGMWRGWEKDYLIT